MRRNCRLGVCVFLVGARCILCALQSLPRQDESGGDCALSVLVSVSSQDAVIRASCFGVELRRVESPEHVEFVHASDRS